MVDLHGILEPDFLQKAEGNCKVLVISQLSYMHFIYVMVKGTVLQPCRCTDCILMNFFTLIIKYCYYKTKSLIFLIKFIKIDHYWYNNIKFWLVIKKRIAGQNNFNFYSGYWHRESLSASGWIYILRKICGSHWFISHLWGEKTIRYVIYFIVSSLSWISYNFIFSWCEMMYMYV